MELNSVDRIYLNNEIFSYSQRISHRDFSSFQFHYLHYAIKTEKSPDIHSIEFALSNSALKVLILYYSIRILNRAQGYLPKAWIIDFTF